ncbi:MAG: hypothetical protein ACREXP_05575 [Steroidobacteraceae bacterium]
MTLHHARTHSSHVRRESSTALTRRVDHVHTYTTASVVAPAAQRTAETPSARSTVASVRAAEIASLPPRPRRRAVMTLATPPKEARAPAFVQPAANQPMRAPAATTSLVWRKSAPTAAEQAEQRAQPDIDSPSAPARSSSPAATNAAIPTITAQQAREAVRANLLDSAVADRLADDVIRRVEKRMRIERERRGL